MLDEVLGLPAHPLIVHAAVVLVPLLVLAAVAYAALPRWRAHLAWALAALAVAAPLSAFAAKESGERFLARRAADEPGIAERMLGHQEYGTVVMWTSIALGLASLALIVLRREAEAPERARERRAGVLPYVTAGLAGLAVLGLVAHVVLLFIGSRGVGPIIVGLTAVATVLGVAGARSGVIPRAVASTLVIVSVLALSAGAGVHVLLSGHSGAVAVWSGTQ